ncbi:MAG: hypothetical protein F4W90_00800 [Gammaproteobacteria bacterium]|nr:hypothetical protein [Gammaproteobacteria bacterium]
MSDSALAAYWRFFETFNTRDAYAFSSAMNYPQVRVSWARQAVVLADMEAHALSVSWDAFIASGWDHTNGAEPQVVAQSNAIAHINGGWTRVDAQGNAILSNRVCYIATNVDGHWGIQSRFGTDPGQRKALDQQLDREAASNHVSAFLHALDAGNGDAAWSYLADEFLQIGVGAVVRHKHGDELWLPYAGIEALRIIQSGPSSATFSAALDNRHALFYVTVDSENRFQIKAGSWL